MFQAIDNFRMVAASVGNGGTLPELDVSMLLLVYGGGISRVRDIHHDSCIRLERVGNLASAQQPDFLHDVAHGADLGIDFLFAFLEQAEGFGHSKGADAVVEST